MASSPGRPVLKRRRSGEQVVPCADAFPPGRYSSLRSRESCSADQGADDYPFPDFASTYAKMRDPEKGLELSDRRYGIRVYAKCFVGSEALDWMVKNLSLTREEALERGRKLLEAGIVQHVTHSEPFRDGYFFYRFQEDEETSVLNMKRFWDPTRPTGDAVEVSKKLLIKLACLCEEFRFKNISFREQGENRGSVTPVGSPNLSGSSYSQPNVPASDSDDVDYERLAKSEEFRRYCLAAAELQCVQLIGLAREELLAFFVNIYNLLCLHALVVHGPPTYVWQRWNFFRRLSYRIAGLDMNLDDIEHGILRGNKRPPMFKFMQQLRPLDPKCQHILSERDGRIHFVISAGTKSDPPIRILDAEEVEEQLHEATEEFLDKCVKVDMARHVVTLPRIFRWYADDFPTPQKNTLVWVMKYLTGERARNLQALISEQPDKIVVEYESFDWGSSDTRFNAAVVRRKRRKLERQRTGGTDLMSPNLLGIGEYGAHTPVLSPTFPGLIIPSSLPGTPALNLTDPGARGFQAEAAYRAENGSIPGSGSGFLSHIGSQSLSRTDQSPHSSPRVSFSCVPISGPTPTMIDGGVGPTHLTSQTASQKQAETNGAKEDSALKGFSEAKKQTSPEQGLGERASVTHATAAQGPREGVDKRVAAYKE